MTHKALVIKIAKVLNNKGQGMTEYILVISLIALAVVSLWPPLAKSLIDKFTQFAAAISSS